MFQCFEEFTSSNLCYSPGCKCINVVYEEKREKKSVLFSIPNQKGQNFTEVDDDHVSGFLTRQGVQKRSEQRVEVVTSRYTKTRHGSPTGWGL